MNKSIRKKVEEFSYSFKWTPKNYYWEHTLLVRKLALFLQKEIGGNIDVVELSALLHDIGKAKLLALGHEKISAELSKEFLKKLKIEESIIDNVMECISYEKIDLIEARILRSADSMSLIEDKSGGKEWYFENVLGNDKSIILDEIKKSYQDIEFDFGKAIVLKPYKELINRYS